jgi:Tfp pilus assembly protein PilO
MIDRLPPLVARIVREHQRVLTVLGVGLVLNVLTYAFGVYPLSQRVANVEQRNASALQTLDAARKDHGSATGTLAGKDRATTELATFYTSVLPRDLASARRLTHLRIAQMAREHGLAYGRSTSEPDSPLKDSTLTRLNTQVSLTGSYAEIRRFIHALETAPEFVVIDNVQLAESRDSGDGVQLTLALSTFYRGGQQP